MKWAINKKIEKERNARGDPLGCDAAGEVQEWPTWGTEDDWQCYQQWPDEGWKDDRGEGETKEGEMKEEDAADYVVPKGGNGTKGKGFKGYGGWKGYGKNTSHIGKEEGKEKQ